MVLVREVHESVAVMMGGIAAGVALLVIGVIFPSDRVWSIGLIAPLLAGLGGGLYAT